MRKMDREHPSYAILSEYPVKLRKPGKGTWDTVVQGVLIFGNCHTVKFTALHLNISSIFRPSTKRHIYSFLIKILYLIIQTVSRLDYQMLTKITHNLTQLA